MKRYGLWATRQDQDKSWRLYSQQTYTLHTRGPASLLRGLPRAPAVSPKARVDAGVCPQMSIVCPPSCPMLRHTRCSGPIAGGWAFLPLTAQKCHQLGLEARMSTRPGGAPRLFIVVAQLQLQQPSVLGLQAGVMGWAWPGQVVAVVVDGAGWRATAAGALLHRAPEVGRCVASLQCTQVLIEVLSSAWGPAGPLEHSCVQPRLGRQRGQALRPSLYQVRPLGAGWLGPWGYLPKLPRRVQGGKGGGPWKWAGPRPHQFRQPFPLAGNGSSHDPAQVSGSGAAEGKEALA